MKLILLNLIILIAITSTAQPKKARVYLNSGSVINGKVVGAENAKTITVETKYNTWVFPKSDLDTIIYKREKTKPEPVVVPWFFKVDGGVLSGNNENEEQSIRYFQSTFNYGIFPKFFAGGGTGAEYYLGQTFIPLFINLEYWLRQTRFTPHFFVKAGYLFPGENQQPSDLYDEQEPRNLPPKYLNAHGGMVFNPGFGFTQMFSPNFGFSLAAGYRYHVLRYSGKEEYQLEQHYNRLSFSLSLIFK